MSDFLQDMLNTLSEWSAENSTPEMGVSPSEQKSVTSEEKVQTPQNSKEQVAVDTTDVTPADENNVDEKEQGAVDDDNVDAESRITEETEQHETQDATPSNADSSIVDETPTEETMRDNQSTEVAESVVAERPRIFLMTETERRAFLVYAQQCNMRGTCAVLRGIAPPHQEIDISDLKEKEELSSSTKTQTSKLILPAEKRALECCSVIFGELPAGYRIKFEIRGMVEEIDVQQQRHYLSRWSERYFTSRVELRNFLCNDFAAGVDSASSVYGKMRRGLVKPVATLIGKNKELFTGVAVRLNYEKFGSYGLMTLENLLPIAPTLIWIHDASVQLFWKFQTPILVEWKDAGDFFSDTAGAFASALKNFWFKDFNALMNINFKPIDIPTTNAKECAFFKVDESKSYTPKDFRELAQIGLQCANFV